MSSASVKEPLIPYLSPSPPTRGEDRGRGRVRGRSSSASPSPRPSFDPAGRAGAVSSPRPWPRQARPGVPARGEGDREPAHLLAVAGSPPARLELPAPVGVRL